MHSTKITPSITGPRGLLLLLALSSPLLFSACEVYPDAYGYNSRSYYYGTTSGLAPVAERYPAYYGSRSVYVSPARSYYRPGVPYYRGGVGAYRGGYYGGPGRAFRW